MQTALAPAARLLGLTLVVLVAAAVGACSTSPSTPTERPHAEQKAPWLVYQRDLDTRTVVTLIRTDGSDGHSPLADIAGGQTNPDWDPTGTRLVFALSEGTTDDLWVTDVEGTQPRRLLDCVAPCREIDDPSWSPDGKSIVFSRTLDLHGTGVSTLEVVDVDTGRTEVVLGPSARQFTAGARWSPDGQNIVFELVRKVDRGVDSDISGVTLSIVSRNSKFHAVRRLTDPALFAATADWSPDGQWIVYSALATPSDAAPDLYVLRPGGGAPRRVTDLATRGGYAGEPTFTGDSGSIVFSGRIDSPGPSLLLRVGLDGTRLGPALGADEVPGAHPRLQPVP